MSLYYYDEATLIHNGEEYRVFADLQADTVDTTMLGGPPTETLGRWYGSIDMRLRGRMPQLRDRDEAVLQLPNGREARVAVGELLLQVDEPVRWRVRGIGYPPFVVKSGEVRRG
jgi:hypothetical protein